MPKTTEPSSTTTTTTTTTAQSITAEAIESRRHQMSSSRALLLLAGALVCLAWAGQPSGAFPSGAPDSACKDLKPGHGVEAQTGESPFELSQDKLNAEQAGDQIKVTLSSPTKTNFKGLIVQAVDEKGEPIGRFLPGKGLKTLDSCAAVTHADREAKKTATLVWEAPSELKARQVISFRASVVVKMDEFYTGLKSKLAAT